MIPLRVTAYVTGEVTMPEGYIHLDALLAFAVVRRDEIPPAYTEEELVPVEIPVEREPDGRFHLASASVAEWENVRTHWTIKRSPIEHMMQRGARRTGKINLSAGVRKHYRIPSQTGHLVDDRLAWWCVGDPDKVRALLSLITRVGKHRGRGFGTVRRWEVEECETWDGFPVLLDGAPLRHLPPDYPGLDLSAGMLRYGTLTYPFWAMSRQREVVAPAP